MLTIQMFDIKLPPEKSIRKELGLQYSSREPIPADKKRQVMKRAGNKCEVWHTKPSGVTLEFHHKNMKNYDNRLSNLQLLCPNHHGQKHAKMRRKVYRDFLGRKYTSRLVKKTKGKTKERPKTPLERLTKKLKRDFM